MNSLQDTPSSPGPHSEFDSPTVYNLELPSLADGAESMPPLVESAADNPLHQIRTQLQVCIGEVHLTVGELMQAREHQVLLIDRELSQPVDLLIEGRVVARGELVSVGDQFAVRITELPLPLKP